MTYRLEEVHATSTFCWSSSSVIIWIPIPVNIDCIRIALAVCDNKIKQTNLFGEANLQNKQLSFNVTESLTKC